MNPEKLDPADAGQPIRLMPSNNLQSGPLLRRRTSQISLLVLICGSHHLARLIGRKGR